MLQGRAPRTRTLPLERHTQRSMEQGQWYSVQAGHLRHQWHSVRRAGGLGQGCVQGAPCCTYRQAVRERGEVED